MPLLRCSRSLLRSSSRTSGLQRTCTPHWRLAYCAVHVRGQTCGKHNHSSQRQPTLASNQIQLNPIIKPASVRQEADPSKYEVHFTPSDRKYRDTEEEQPPEIPEAKVRRVRPTIFVLVLSSGIYAFLSYRQAKNELKPQNWNIPNPLSQWQPQRRTAPTPTEVVTKAWDQLDPISKLSWGIIGTNTVIHLSSFVLPGLWERLWHVPAMNINATLLTSAFVHAGAMHFGFNMWACYNFLPPVGYSRLFRGDTNHVLSFYLSTALVSSLAQHLAATVFTKGRAIPSIFIPSGGASGALFAIIGAFCAQYPTHQVGIIFLPFQFDAQYFLPALMLFDFVGMVRGYSFVNFGHAAHFSGALLGVGYSYFDGHKNVWRPSVEFWKRRLRDKA